MSSFKPKLQAENMNNKILGSLTRNVPNAKMRARSVSKDFKLMKDYQVAWRQQEKAKRNQEMVDKCTFKPDIKKSA